ncbi:MAG: HEAT repeat domain-containing protein [Planctomycetota bacterium]
MTFVLALLLLAGPEPSRIDYGGSVADRVKLLRHENPAVRQRAAELLQIAPPDRALAAMLVALGDRDRYVREAAARTLRVWKDERATPFLVKAVRSERQPRTLRLLLIALGDCGGRYAARAVKPFLEHPDRGVRGAAATALGAIGDAGQRTPLWDALRLATDDPDFLVRSAVLGAFVRLGWKDDAQEAIAELEKAGAARSWRARVSIVVAIGELRWKERTEALLARIETERDPRVLAAAVGALAQLGQGDVVAAYLDDPRPTVQSAALVSLQAAKDPRAPSAAHTLLQASGNVQVRFTAAMVLHRAGDERANVYLVDALRSRDAYIWVTALAALEKRYGEPLGRNPDAWTAFFKQRNNAPDR